MSDALASFGSIHLTATGVYYQSARRLEMAGLEHVDGIAVTYSSHPILVFAAVLAGVGAGVAEDEGRVLAVVVALGCFLAFLATRRLGARGARREPDHPGVGEREQVRRGQRVCALGAWRSGAASRRNMKRFPPQVALAAFQLLSAVNAVRPPSAAGDAPSQSSG